jgi:hypothetical protein
VYPYRENLTCSIVHVAGQEVKKMIEIPRDNLRSTRRIGTDVHLKYLYIYSYMESGVCKMSRKIVAALRKNMQYYAARRMVHREFGEMTCWE